MFKRLAAFLFILTMAGQVYAGVCGCLGRENATRHSCCKRQKSVGDSFSGKGCCDTESCVAKRSEKPIQDRSKPAAKLKFVAANELPELPRVALKPVDAFDDVRIPLFANHRLKYSRAPELYLRHRAFRI